MTPRFFAAPLLLLLSLLVLPNCGTEIGNPLLALFGGGGEQAAMQGSPAPNGGTLFLGSDFANDCGGSPFSNGTFHYRLKVPTSWTTDSHDLANLLFDNSLKENHSVVSVQAQTLTTPINDLLTYLQTSQPGIVWTEVTNSQSTPGVLRQDPVLNVEGSNVYTLYFTENLVLLRIDLVLNTTDNGDVGGSCIVNTLQFLN